LFYVLIAVGVAALGASSEQPATEHTAHENPGAEVDAETLEVIGPADRLEEGWERVRRGDYEGGAIMADQVLATGQAAFEEEALYLKGFSLEWAGQLEEALGIFDDILGRWPDGRYYRDSLFRKTETLGKLGRYAEALNLLKTNFESDKDLSEADHIKIDLLKGIWLLEQGKSKPGMRVIATGLDRSSPDQVTWYQGQANSALVKEIVSRIESLTLKGGKAKMRKRLTEQAALINAAETLLKMTLDLKEPAWILDQIHSIGNAYQILGDHLRAAPVGALDVLQRATYEQELRARIETVYIKGLKYYELGLKHADRVQWAGHRTEGLRTARDELAAKIEAL
jgi:tetratricopeptide (TPR) repeat protein